MNNGSKGSLGTVAVLASGIGGKATIQVHVRRVHKFQGSFMHKGGILAQRRRTRLGTKFGLLIAVSLTIGRGSVRIQESLVFELVPYIGWDWGHQIVTVLFGFLTAFSTGYDGCDRWMS